MRQVGMYFSVAALQRMLQKCLLAGYPPAQSQSYVGAVLGCNADVRPQSATLASHSAAIFAHGGARPALRWQPAAVRFQSAGKRCDHDGRNYWGQGLNLSFVSASSLSSRGTRDPSMRRTCPNALARVCQSKKATKAEEPADVGTCRSMERSAVFKTCHPSGAALQSYFILLGESCWKCANKSRKTLQGGCAGKPFLRED